MNKYIKKKIKKIQNSIPYEILQKYLAGTVKACAQSTEYPQNHWRVVALHCVERLDSR